MNLSFSKNTPIISQSIFNFIHHKIKTIAGNKSERRCIIKYNSLKLNTKINISTNKKTKAPLIKRCSDLKRSFSKRTKQHTYIYITKTKS